MSKDLTQKALRAKNQAKWWKYAAWTLPLSALSFISFVYYVGFEGWYSQAIVLTTTLFFTASVLWWWWALHKLVDILKGLETTAQGLQSIKNGIQEFKQLLRGDHDSDREWRE